jgi:hypothetical protein
MPLSSTLAPTTAPSMSETIGVVILRIFSIFHISGEEPFSDQAFC